jgi:hypothetical protein
MVQTGLLLVALVLASFVAFAGCSYNYATLEGVVGSDGGGSDTIGSDTVAADTVLPDVGAGEVSPDAMVPDATPDMREAPPLDAMADAVLPNHCKNFPSIVCTSDADCGACAGTGSTAGAHCPTIGSTATACCVGATCPNCVTSLCVAG